MGLGVTNDVRSLYCFSMRLFLVVAIVNSPATTGVGLIAGEWVKQPGVFKASGLNNKSAGTCRDEGYEERFSWASNGVANEFGGSSCVRAFSVSNTMATWFTDLRATAEPPAASASGSSKTRHGLPSHGQGQCQGIYRASAKVSLSFSAALTATGATASMVGGGGCNSSCAAGVSTNYSISQFNIGCDTNSAKEYGFGFTGPGGAGLEFNTTQSQVGRYDSGPQLFTYVFSVDEVRTSYSEVTFYWQCDASLRLSSYAKPGWMASSRASGNFEIESRVSDVVLEVIDGPPGY